MALVMMDEKIAHRLEQLAHQETKTIDEFLEQILNQYAPPSPLPSSLDGLSPNSIMRLALTAMEMGEGFGSGDLAAHSREILTEEWGQDLLRYKNNG